MPTALPAAVAFTDASVTQGAFKTAISNLRAAIYEMLGDNSTGQVLAPDGTVGAPGIAFASDPDGGMYRIGANHLGIGVNGAKVLDISATGLGVVGDVTSSKAASCAFGTSSAQDLRLVTASADRVVITNATGLVTISTQFAANATAADTFTPLTNSHAATPKGWRILYSAAAPNGTGNEFLYCDDTGGVRATIRSNGGLANYSANNVNLSDLGVKPTYESLRASNLVQPLWDSFKNIDWGRFRYADQTHDDWNWGYNAQDIQIKMGSVAPELVGPWDDEPDGLLGVYGTDLCNIGLAMTSEAMLRSDNHEARIAALEGAATIH